MKKAFTLAEVLITLGIIGVVSTITIPTLITKYKANKLRTQLLRANAIIQQAAMRMKADELNLDEIVNKRDYQTIHSYFKNGGCTLPKHEIEAKYKNYEGKLPAAGAAASDLIYPFCMIDGMVLWLGIVNKATTDEKGGEKWTDSGNTLFAIDINGWGNKPDRYGHDVFFWVYSQDTQMLVPTGAKDYFKIGVGGSFYTICPGVGAEQGIGCTYKALNDKKYFDKLPK